MKKTKKMTVGAAASLSKKAAVGVNCLEVTSTMMTEFESEISTSEMLNLVEIDLDKYDFDDVHENVQKLLVHFFGDEFYQIEKLVSEFSDKSGLDYDDYDEFMRLAAKGKFKKWFEYSNKICSGKPEVANAVLDLYFQKTMIPSPDIHNDLLIYAYIEDIQPFLN